MHAISNTHGDARFAETRWSLVLRAKSTNPAEADGALDELYKRYRFPLYAHLRRTRADEEARDLLQGFFEKLIEKNWLSDASSERGRFRSFLLASLKHFAANDWRHSQAFRRGGGWEICSWDELALADRYLLELGNDLAPDLQFDQRWAFEVLNHALAALRDEYTHKGEEARFTLLEPTILPGSVLDGYASLAVRLGLTVNGVKSAVRS